MAVTVGTFTPAGASSGGILVRMVPEGSGVGTFDIISVSNSYFAASWNTITIASGIPSQYRPTSTTTVCGYANIRSDINDYPATIRINASGDIIVGKTDGTPDPNWNNARPYVIDKVQFTIAKI